MAFSSDGKTVASGSEDQSVCLWEVSTGQCLYVLQGHSIWVYSVTFSPDGAIVASGSGDGTIRFWDAYTGKHLKMLKNIRPYEAMNITGLSEAGICAASVRGGRGDCTGIKLLKASVTE